MEPDDGERVGAPVQRVNPTVLAAIALGALVLLIVAMMVIGNRSSEDDRLTNEEIGTVQADPAARCSNRATFDQIKRELFRRAAAVRGSDQTAFDKIASYSTVRMEAPTLRDEGAEADEITCNGTLTLDLPPGVAVAGGRRSLSADILYTIGAGSLSIANADEIIAPLATLSRTAGAAGDDLLPTGNEVVPADPANTVDAVEPADDLAPLPDNAASPSFNCANARSSGEIAVCNNPGLAALDRRMAAQFASALSDADARQRAQLNRTRDSFLTYRDRCTSDDCIADTYRGRMREIRDIMLGQWTPQR